MKSIFSSVLILIALFGYAQTVSQFIIVDQFGYRPSSKKVAVIKDPQNGFDASLSFTPGNIYQVVNANTNAVVFTGSPVQWDGGATDASSGDKAWWFDFSSVNTDGEYFILDFNQNLKSFNFRIGCDVYNDVLRQAVRTFFYQRVGHAKQAPYAETGWTDGASHMGPLQDTEARIYNAPGDASTERDVSGGWYDAGDYNKYTPWTANYCLKLSWAYLENPTIWTDDFNIPESGNGIPDLLDEIKYGLDHLLRMQNFDGSAYAVVDESHARPPSAATGPSLYGDINTVSALSIASAFAYSQQAYRAIGMVDYADTLLARAELAWNWAEANPNVIWRNNDAAFGSAGIAAGQQEVDNYGRLWYKVSAAVYLFEATGNAIYRNYVDVNYNDINMMQWNFAFPYQQRQQKVLLHYASLPGATAAVANDINNTYLNAMNGANNFTAFDNEVDPYRAHLDSYVWGSNNIKCRKGMMFIDYLRYGINPARDADAMETAEDYIHYIHGVNPLNKVYLSNMYAYGGDSCVNEFYHTWFHDGDPDWDRVGVSTYGPAPGFLVGGPNASYDWDGCCPGGCGSAANNARCFDIAIDPPKNQPDQKSYLDFNQTWPLNSWSVTENSCGYQVSYIYLLSKFIDCPLPLSINDRIDDVKGENTIKDNWSIVPNPAKADFIITNPNVKEEWHYSILDSKGRIVQSSVSNENSCEINLKGESGIYHVIIRTDSEVISKKLILER